MKISRSRSSGTTPADSAMANRATTRTSSSSSCTKDDRPFMPVEFAVAAYRFGHIIIRPFYVINQTSLDRGGVPVFGAVDGFNLNGARPVPADLVVGWKNMLPVEPTVPARKPREIDTKLSLPLTARPGSVVPPPDPTTAASTGRRT